MFPKSFDKPASKLYYPIFRLRNWRKDKFECPICHYRGPFMDLDPPTGYRKHAKCPQCGAFERHRLQFLVADNILNSLATRKLKMLHFAPEVFFRRYFSERFETYETADLLMKGVDHNVDLRKLPFKSESYDFVFASQVLTYIREDTMALAEIRRILRPEGIAMLPVPVVAEKTIEYPNANPYEACHVRAVGQDYFDRFIPYFRKVELIGSDSLPPQYQLYTYEDRSRMPTKECPLRPPMQGEKHVDIVPVCYA
jgi:SAM-dependent methyltransferase